MSVFDQLKQSFWWLPFGHVSEINADELDALLAGEMPKKHGD